MAHTHKQTEIYHTANGSTTSFSYPFEYYQKSDVHVTVNGTAKTQGTHYDVTGTNVVFKTSPTDYTPANTEVVRVYRDTDVNTSKATFAAGSSIRATDLNNNETQLLFSVQEAVDQEIVTADIRDGQITSAKIKDGAVTADQIGANALTYAKIQNVSATNRVLGRDTSGAGIIEEITPANLRTMINVEDGSQANPTNAEIRTAVEAASDSNVFTDADHSKLDGIAAGAEVNVQSDWNSTSGDNFILNKPTIPELIDEDNFSSDSATKAPSQQSVKAYITATSQPLDAELTELSTMDSGTASALADLTTAEVQILDGATVTTEELNILDGVTATAAELNYVDGVTSNVQTQIDAKQPLDSDLTTLAGMPSATASILASSTELTSTTAELNLLDGKSVVTSVSGSSTDVQLPTAKAVNDQIVNTLSDVGGFVPIADELKFPNTNPDPNDDAGTIVSIADAGGIVVNGSGVSTTGRTLGGSTVTINGIDSSLNNTTIAAGKGMLVQTTSTLNTYDYHRLIVDEAGVASAQTLVSDFNDRYQVASSAPSNHPDGSALQDGDLWFDTAANVMKVYDLGNTSYAAVTSVGDYKLLTLQDTDGSAADFTNQTFNLRDGSSAANVTSVGQLLVSVNGVLQKPNAGTNISNSDEGFCLVDSDTIKFSVSPGAGASVFVTLIGSATSINVPADNSVAEAKIQNGAVSTDKIADQAVALTKLPHGDGSSNGKYLRSNNGADPTWETVAQYSTPLTTQGDLLYRDASGDQRLAKGTNGQFLKIGANDPEWADIPAGVGGANGVTFNDDVEVKFGSSGDAVIDYTGSSNAWTFETSTANSYIHMKPKGAFVIYNDSTVNTEFNSTNVYIDAPILRINGVDGSTGARIELLEDSAGPVGHGTTIEGASGLSADWTLKLPAAAPASNGQALTATTAGVASWATITSSVANGCIYENDDEITDNYTIASDKRGHTVGPVTVSATVTVNGNWVIS